MRGVRKDENGKVDWTDLEGPFNVAEKFVLSLLYVIRNQRIIDREKNIQKKYSVRMKV